MYTKLFSSMFDGSLMLEDLPVRYVFMCLLTLADSGGFIDVHPRVIALRIGLDEAAVRRAIDRLCQADPESRSTEEQGRRLLPMRESFGWKVTNFDKYRDMGREADRRDYNREYMRQYRAPVSGSKVAPQRGPAKTRKEVVKTCKDESTTVKSSAEYEYESSSEKRGYGGDELREAVDSWKSVLPSAAQPKAATVKRIASKFRSVTEQLRQEIDGFSWPELIARIPGQPWLLNECRAFDLEWLLANDRSRKPNALKVWALQYVDTKASSKLTRQAAVNQGAPSELDRLLKGDNAEVLA